MGFASQGGDTLTEFWNWGKKGLTEYIWAGLLFWYRYSQTATREYLTALARLVGPVQVNIFLQPKLSPIPLATQAQLAMAVHTPVSLYFVYGSKFGAICHQT